MQNQRFSIHSLTGFGIRGEVILDAIGNSRLTEYSDFVLSYLGSEKMMLRKSAIENYIKIMKNVDAGLIWSFLKKETTAEVRVALINALQKSTDLDPDYTEQILTWIGDGYSEKERLATIVLINARSEAFSRKKELFRNMLTKERNPQIIKALMEGLY